MSKSGVERLDIRFCHIYMFKGYTEFAIFKETKAVMNYIKSAGITVDQLEGLIKITDTSWYWDMMEHENRNVDLNRKIQDEFVNYVFGDMSEEEAVGKSGSTTTSKKNKV